jgi:hypothetical protein
MCAEYESAMRNLVASSEGSCHLQSRTEQYCYLPRHSGCDGGEKARTRHGSGSLHKTLFEISHIRSNLLMRGAIMCRVPSRMTFSNLRSNCGSGGTYLSSCPALQPVCRITQGAASLPCALRVTASQNVRPHIRLRFDFLFVVTIEIASYSQDPGSLTGEEKALRTAASLVLYPCLRQRLLRWRRVSRTQLLSGWQLLCNSSNRKWAYNCKNEDKR